GAAAGAGADAATAPATTFPSTNRAMISLLSTVSPSPFKISALLPSAGATTSSTTLSVSISTISSSRLTDSPGFLCLVAIVPSAMDSGNVGALISILMLFPLAVALGLFDQFNQLKALTP